MYHTKFNDNYQVCQLAIIDVPLDLLECESLLIQGCPTKQIPLNRPDSLFYLELLESLFKRLAECDFLPTGFVFENRNFPTTPGDVYEWRIGSGIHKKYQHWLTRHWLSSLSFFFDTKRQTNVFTIILLAYYKKYGEDLLDE